MNFTEWTNQLNDLTDEVETAYAVWEMKKLARDRFLQESLGFAPGDVATVEGTAKMIAAIIDMKREDKNNAVTETNDEE